MGPQVIIRRASNKSTMVSKEQTKREQAMQEMIERRYHWRKIPNLGVMR